MRVLDKFGIALRGAHFDTMIAAYLLRAGERRNELAELIIDFFEKNSRKKMSSWI